MKFYTISTDYNQDDVILLKIDSMKLWKISLFKQYSDEEICRMMYQWDQAIFEKLYERYKDKIYTYTMYLCNYNKWLAQDITSETFLNVFEYCGKTEEIKSVKNLIYQIAHNIAIDYMKKDSKTIDWIKNEESILDESQNIRHEIDKEIRDKITFEALQELEWNYRECIFLYYFEDRSYDEIAEILWTNKNTVWTYIIRWKEKLKKIMNKYGIELI